MRKSNVATVYRQMHQAAERTESELGEEKYSYINSCMRDWESLPYPDGPITVGIDGGYIQGREGDNRKAGWFEAIVGKSITEQGESKCFAFVHDYDQKPNRRLFELLTTQGLQLNQTITFLSDGGDTVRDLQFYYSPFSEHLLDWFHITMRITVMKQMAKGLPKMEQFEDIEKEIERVKWYLWHGNVFMALQVLDRLLMLLEPFDDQKGVTDKLWNAVCEFNTYITNNAGFIPNYRDRYFYGEKISTGFVESAVNQVVSKRMVKKQQMRWTKKGAHLLLQVRTQVLNDDWRNSFCRWYPQMSAAEEYIQIAA
ncbi:MAG: ISKra4 family transposase [Planctomycetota bacterium]